MNMGPRLYLEVIDSPSITPGTKYEIDNFGLKNSSRTEKDGKVYVGSMEFNKKNKVVNDIIVPPNNDPNIEKKHFVISFDENEKSYSLTDMKSGTGTFVKLEEPFNLGQKRIASFGNSHMVVATNSNGISLTFIDGPKVNEAFHFNREEKVMIGRMED